MEDLQQVLQEMYGSGDEMSKTNQSEDNIIQMPNFVAKLKQDRHGMWICSELRVQADTTEELKESLDDASKVVEDKCIILNAR